MFGYKEINLKRKNGKKFFYQKERIDRLLRKIIKESQSESFWNQKTFFIQKNLSPEYVDKRNKKNIRVENLRRAYQFLNEEPDINEESVHTLYEMITNGLLDSFSEENMGALYRTRDVYILNAYDRMDFDKGFSPEEIHSHMKDIFSYEKGEEKSLEEILLKSQIIHFYFVYVHPYYDGNGRTARMLAEWYLLKRKAYPFILFNRGVSFTPVEYKKSIQKARSGDLTSYLEYMLKTIEKELKKEKIIHQISSNQKERLSLLEEKFLLYLLSTSQPTIQEIRDCYELQEDYSKTSFATSILSLLERGILTIVDNNIKINRKCMSSKEKIKTKEESLWIKKKLENS